MEHINKRAGMEELKASEQLIPEISEEIRNLRAILESMQETMVEFERKMELTKKREAC